MPQERRPENSHTLAVFSPTAVKQRAKLTTVCTKSRFMGSMSPNRAYIVLLTRLTPRPAIPRTTLKKMHMQAENC